MGKATGKQRKGSGRKSRRPFALSHALPLSSRVAGRGILGTSALRSSRKFGLPPRSEVDLEQGAGSTPERVARGADRDYHTERRKIGD